MNNAFHLLNSPEPSEFESPPTSADMTMSIKATKARHALKDGYGVRTPVSAVETHVSDEKVGLHLGCFYNY